MTAAQPAAPGGRPNGVQRLRATTSRPSIILGVVLVTALLPIIGCIPPLQRLRDQNDWVAGFATRACSSCWRSA